MPTPQSALAALAATTLAATLVAVAAPTTPAHATVPASATTLPGSIVLLKDYNIWLVRPDGTGLVQVTKDGTFASQYYSPSMADDGTIAAGKGQEIIRLKQNGTVLNRMDPPPLTNSVGQPQDGVPVGVAISPDGTRIAWSTASDTCPVAADCGARTVTGVTSASVLTPPTTTSYFGDPSWVSNTRLMVHGGYGSQMMLQDIGGSPHHWFDDREVYSSDTDLGDGWVSRDGRLLVARRGYGSTSRIFTYRTAGDPRSGDPTTLATPSPDCATNADAKISDPTAAPDGSAFATAEVEGVSVMTIGATCETNQAWLLVPGATEPFWSPAAISPDAGAGPATAPTPGPAPAPAPPAQSFTMLDKPVVLGKVAVGRKVRASLGRWSPTPSATRVVWLRNGKPIRSASRTTYRVTRADAGKKVSVRVTVRGSGLPARTATSAPRRVRR
jgi:hypothetical protein